MMTSLNGNNFRVTGPLCGEFTGFGEFPAQRPVTLSFDVFFDLRPNKRLSKQPWGWWFETPSWSLWRQCNECSRWRNECKMSAAGDENVIKTITFSLQCFYFSQGNARRQLYSATIPRFPEHKRPPNSEYNATHQEIYNVTHQIIRQLDVGPSVNDAINVTDKNTSDSMLAPVLKNQRTVWSEYLEDVYRDKVWREYKYKICLKVIIFVMICKIDRHDIKWF